MYYGEMAIRKGIFRKKNVYFEEGIGEEKVAEVLAEVSDLGLSFPSLMTLGALCIQIYAPESVAEEIKNLSIGSCMLFDGKRIVRWSNSTYTVTL